MQRSLAVVGLLLATVVSGVLHFYALVLHLIGTCGVSDTAEQFPATASWQGVACGNGSGWTEMLPSLAFGASAVLSVALLAVLWVRSDHLRTISWLPVVVCPLATMAVLALPPDTCSDEARRAHPAYDCRTTPDG